MSLEESPPYTSPPSPHYSPEPSEDEERLAFTCRHRRRDAPISNFQKKSGQITLTLHEQDDKAQFPLYQQNAVVSGTIALENCEQIHSVILKVLLYSARVG